MIYDFESYRYVIMKALSESDPLKLTEKEFVYCTETLRRVLDTSINMDTAVNADVMAKAHVVLGILCNYPEIIKQPADVPVFMFSDAINLLTLQLKSATDFKSATDIFTALNLQPRNFPIKIK